MKEIPVNLPELRALYQKIGQEAGLEKILLDFYHRMSADVMLSHFFTGKDIPSIALKQKQFLMRAMGASPTYSGKPPAQAHAQMPKILSGHFDRRLRILEDVLRAYGLQDSEIQAWIAFENAFREGIVDQT